MAWLATARRLGLQPLHWPLWGAPALPGALASQAKGPVALLCQTHLAPPDAPAHSLHRPGGWEVGGTSSRAPCLSGKGHFVFKAHDLLLLIMCTVYRKLCAPPPHCSLNSPSPGTTSRSSKAGFSVFINLQSQGSLGFSCVWFVSFETVSFYVSSCLSHRSSGIIVMHYQA